MEAARAAAPRPALTKLIDIGPGGVIHPGSAQDLRYAGNARYFADTRTPWIRMWADWPTLQPHPGFAPSDPRSPGYWRVQALDAQIALARARGLKVLLMPYRFPTWVNGTSQLAARRNDDTEIAFRRDERMSAKEWDTYVRAGRDAHRYNPRRRALEYMLPEDPYGPDSRWARFFVFLYGRYGGEVDGFELVNEPNLQLWPQPGIERHVARLLATAQRVSGSFGHAAMLYAPSISDDDAATGPLHTRYDDFVPALLDACDDLGYVPHARQAWSHHNYTDVEKRLTRTRTQRIRALLAGRWTGYGGSAAPIVFVTEGGARLDAMPALYPGEEPRLAQARCIREAWTRHRDTPAGAGVAMLAQYLLYADPNFDCGLLDAYPSTEERPAYAAWKAFPVDKGTVPLSKGTVPLWRG
jgi:hypothetical protein